MLPADQGAEDEDRIRGVHRLAAAADQLDDSPVDEHHQQRVDQPPQPAEAALRAGGCQFAAHEFPQQVAAAQEIGGV